MVRHTMVTTDWFFDTFWEYFLQTQYIALAVSAFVVTILVKAAIFAISRYKKLGGSLLVSTINTLVSGTALFSLFFFNVRFTEDTLLFICAVFGGIYIIELLFTLILKGKNSFADGLVGSLLGNTFLYMVIMLGIIFTQYPVI